MKDVKLGKMENAYNVPKDGILAVLEFAHVSAIGVEHGTVMDHVKVVMLVTKLIQVNVY